MAENMEGGVPPGVKNKINETGFEGNPEGDGMAAVIVGKEGEMKNLEEGLEFEERAKKLAGYIRKNKKILISKTEMDSLTHAARLSPGAWHLYPNVNVKNPVLNFIDSGGNVAEVQIPEKTYFLKEKFQLSLPVESVEYMKELRRLIPHLGFDSSEIDHYYFTEIISEFKEYKKRKTEIETKETKKPFNF